MNRTIKNIILSVILTIQLILTLLTFVYAFWGKYEHNAPSNIWSIIWSKGLGIILTLWGIIAFIEGIAGLVRSKDNKKQKIISIIIILSVILGMFSMILAIGAHY